MEALLQAQVPDEGDGRDQQQPVEVELLEHTAAVIAGLGTAGYATAVTAMIFSPRYADGIIAGRGGTNTEIRELLLLPRGH